MQIITLIQTKGGSGKTTVAMSLASAALAKGEKVCMFDGDVNRQLLGWQDAYEEADWGRVKKAPWPVALTIKQPPASVEDLYAEVEALEASGTDLLIIDTRPGTYKDTDDLALVADVVVIPAKPAQAEWRLVLSAFKWMEDLSKTISDEDSFPQVRSVLANVPTKIINAAARVGGSKLPQHDRVVLDNLLGTPHFDTMLPNIRLFEHFLHHGPLPVAQYAHRAAKGGTLMANNFEDLTMICISLYDEIKGSAAQ